MKHCILKLVLIKCGHSHVKIKKDSIAKENFSTNAKTGANTIVNTSSSASANSDACTGGSTSDVEVRTRTVMCRSPSNGRIFLIKLI